MVKLILHTGECQYEDDSSIPFRLHVVLRPPEFMSIAFVFLHGGSEDIVARGDTVEELKTWMKTHELDNHPRLTRWKITGPDEFVEEFDRYATPASVPATTGG